MRKGIYTERLLIALTFALLLHFFLVQILVENIRTGLVYKEPVIEVEYLSPIVANQFTDVQTKSDEEKIKKKKDELQKKEDEENETEEEVKKEEGQIVYLGETDSNKAPEKYRYLAEHNSVTDKETKSRFADSRFKNPAPAPQAGESIARKLNINESKKKMPAPDIILKSEKRETEDKEENKSAEKLALKIPKILKSESVNLEESDNGTVKNREHSEETLGKDSEFQFGSVLEKGEELHKKRLAGLFPQDIYSGKYSGGPFSDYLKDVEESDATFLNAKEYKYATFFNRIKKSVSQYWNPSDVILKYDPYGNIYGNKDRLTIVKVKIDSTGNLKDVDVSQSSGVEFLDKVALDAFRAAQPFPNPPKGLIDKNGEITFNFGFYVEFSKSSLRLFRYE